MARHDREESLEEQLAWLDAIKEAEDSTPIAVSAVTMADDGSLSPYPKDPWGETSTPPLFRAAVDSVYSPATPEEAPAEEATANEWLDQAKPAEDSFLAPLKPLPRPDDTDTSLESSRGLFDAGQKKEQGGTAGTTWPKSPEWPQTSFEEPRRSAFDEKPAAEEPEGEPVAPVFGKARAFDEALESATDPGLQRPSTLDQPSPFEQPHPFEQPQPSAFERQKPAFEEAFVAEPREPRRRRHIPIPQATPGGPTADSLDPETLLRGAGRRNAPAGGWRRLVYKASGGWIRPGESPEVRRRRELLGRARTPVATGHHRVAVLSLKGGVGKTTTTVGLGATLAQVRGDRVIAVDANPDRGTLSDKVELETSATVRDLLNEREQVKRYVDIRAFTTQAPSRLEVLASDRDPSISEAFSGADYQSVAQVLENFYSICITDCGTGLLHSAMGGVLGLADQIVLVSSASVDGARAASATLDWLEAHHYGDLVREATVVLCSVRPRSKSAVDIKKLEAHFAARCRAVVRVPYDPHLEEGAEIDLDRLQEQTREAYLQLAAYVGDGFAGASGG
ncbi:MinD/ParA family ATP-binding protein [Nonomuraea soli]|uniref:MinD-like ATPase involved in chromosome partitioning or flagellar assembly n=1 Tax=Nonomuraea soli TaxID=1032476 RepID=A0A7W0CI55_9ACTN|nr:MinD/ParA family protein [Nonomuraea soli]MBA2891657.1 MinD-like ATPase involved in chromosome partitioning or flagellar assembly [Nonomuraea soli]